MSEINTKLKNKGYNPFDTDESKSERKRRKAGGGSVTSSGSDGEEGEAVGLVAFLRGICCCCFYPHPPHPLFSSSVTHRKISRVASTESLAKDNLELSERPAHGHMTPQERLLHARALNRLHSGTTAPHPHGAHNGVTKSGRSTNQPVAAPRSGRPPQTSAAASTSPSNHQLSSQTISSSCPSLLNDSPKSFRRLPVTPTGSPLPARSSLAPRPTQLSLAIHAARSRGNTTPTAGSPASTPTTPRSRSGSWGMVRAGFNSLMKAMTTSPHHRHDPPNGFPHPDEEEGAGPAPEVPEEELIEAACLRPATGGLYNPARECYGSVTLKVVGRQGRWVRVGVCGLAGLPWVGGSGGLMLEVSVEPGGRSRWTVLPHAHGPNVNVKLEMVVKAPRESKTKKKGLVKVSVWVCGRVWRHAAIGHALTPLTEPSDSVTAPIHHHSQLAEDLGVVEVSLRCDYPDTSAEGVGSTQEEVTLTLEVLRARNLRPHHPSVLSKASHSRKKEHVEAVCRVGLWVKGERIERESSTPVRVPVTQDPVFRTRSVFIIHRESLQYAAIIFKVLYTSKWGVEDTVGRVQLGHLLYLGTSPDHTYLKPPTDYNTSITLSHWGQALKTPGPITMWHHLQL